MSVSAATLGERALRRLGVAVVPVADRPALATVIPAATVATNALLALAVIAADETPSSLDQALALAKVTAIHDSLVSQGFVSWSLAAIPQAASEEYMQLTALHLAGSFGKSGDPAQQPVIEARIRKVAVIMGAPAEATAAVLSVHQDFAARGKVRWSIFDIPAAVEDVYTYLAAYQLAPLYGQKSNDLDMAQANQALDRYISLPSSGERVRAEYF